MDISSTYLTSLLKEALTPQPVPSPKADPATTALVKAIVQPPAPSTVPSAQFAAQALSSSLPRSPAQAAQRLFSGEIEDAYRAVIEPEAATDGAPGRRAADADQASRGVAPPQPAPADSSPRIAAAPSLPVSATAAQAAMFAAANSNTKQRGGRPGTRPGHAPQSEPRQPALWVVSIATALVSAAVTTFVLMMIR